MQKEFIGLWQKIVQFELYEPKKMADQEGTEIKQIRERERDYNV